MFQDALLVDKLEKENKLKQITSDKKLTEKLEENVKVVVDCPSTNIKKWTKDVFDLVIKQKIVDLKCEHKADVNNVVVSAASIVAKERREEEIAKLKQKFGVDFGSGYPADPVTKEFLKNNVKDPYYKELIRFSWATTKKLISDEGQGKLF